MADESPHGSINEAERRRLYAALPDLGPRALAILADIAERLQRGAKQYGGDFDDKPRDWDQETFEELADGLVYSTMRLMQLRERRAADAQRAKAALRGLRETIAKVGTGQLGVPSHMHREGPRAYSCSGGLDCPDRAFPDTREDWEKTRDGCG